jgi:hypothetical protein
VDGAGEAREAGVRERGDGRVRVGRERVGGGCVWRRRERVVVEAWLRRGGGEAATRPRGKKKKHRPRGGRVLLRQFVWDSYIIFFGLFDFPFRPSGREKKQQLS